MATEQVTGEGNLVQIKTPKFLSIVGKPANHIAFKVVRSDKGASPMKPTVVRRQRRSEASPVLQMIFPTGYDDAKVASRMTDFGLTGYDVVRQEDGTILARRADLKSISTDGTLTITLTSDGIKAMVASRTDSAPNPKSFVAVTALAFRSDIFDQAKVTAWLADHKVSGDGTSVDKEGEGDYIAVRSEIPEGEESRSISLEEGVTATIIRSDSQDIPDGFVAAVNEAAYGSWGWGQLNFAAAMADEEFSEAMRDAVCTLESVLRNILLYSPLPLDERKALAVLALDQFKEYTVNVLDSLPRQLLVAVVRSAQPQLENSMNAKVTSGGATQQAAQGGDDSATVTRGELRVLIAEAANAAADAAVAAINAKREEGTTAKPATEEVKPTETTPAVTATTEAAITRADIVAAFKEAVAPIDDRMKRLEGTTVLRTDTPDAEGNTPAAATTQAATTTTKEVFRNAPAFAGLRKGMTARQV